MAEYTTHYNLKKPARNENYNIDVANQNNDIIDEKLYGKVDKKAGKDLSTNDFTNEYKKKLDNLKNYDDSEVIKQITSFNERAGKVEEANVEISKNVEVLQEEQTTQNENIEKNAEGIAQNKKDIDEELTKIKKENSLLKSQIPEGHASGNDIHLEDSSNMPFEWRLNGGSRQEMREGYNLANLDADSFTKNGVTVTNNGDGSWTFNGTANSSGDLVLTKNILLFNKIYQFEDTKYLFKTIVVSGSFSNPDNVIVQTSAMGQDNGVDNFATLYNKLSDGVFVNIFNKKSTSHLSRFELYCGPNVTFNNYTIKILFAKTDNKELEWQQYGASPSPQYLSKIENVGDNINVLNKNENFLLTNTSLEVLSTGIKLTLTKAIDWASARIELGREELLGKTVYVNSDIETSGKANTAIRFYWGSESSPSAGGIITNKKNDSKNSAMAIIPQTFPAGCDRINLYFYASNSTIPDVGDYVKYNNLKVTVSKKIIGYSDYNCGSVNIKKTNVNFFNLKEIVEQSANFTEIDNGFIFRVAQSMYSTGVAFEYPISEPISISYKIQNVSATNVKLRFLFDDGSTDTLFDYSSKTDNEEHFICIENYFKANKKLARIGLDWSASGTVQITEFMMNLGTKILPFISHKEQNIVFPLQEGQRLYEGSYLAEDGIHNIRRQDILTGEESLKNYHSNTSNGFVGFSFIMSNKHKKNADFLCTHLTKNSDNVYYNRGLGGWLPDEDKWCYICVPISILKDVSTPEKQIESMKEYLKEQYNAGTPMKFEYELATEEIIPYTEAQQAVINEKLYTYKNVTNISVDNELATLDITYKKDIETMFNNQAKEYNERLSNIESLLNTTSTSALLLDNLESDLEKEV